MSMKNYTREDILNLVEEKTWDLSGCSSPIFSEQ